MICGACRGQLDLNSNQQVVDLFRCNVCGCWNRIPRHTYDENLISYTTNYESKEKILINSVAKFGSIIDKIEKYAPIKKLFDVGCYIGELSYVAKSKGWEASGNDIRQSHLDYGTKELGLFLHLGHFEKLNLINNSIGALTFHHGVEHVLDPIAVMNKAYEVLVPGGVLYFNHPRIPSDGTVGRFAEKGNLLGGHSYEWTFGSFRYFLNQFKDKFEVIESHSGEILDFETNNPPGQEWVLRKI